MEDILFIGTSQAIVVTEILQEACILLSTLGIQTEKGDLVPIHGQSAREPQTNALKDGCCIQLEFQNSVLHVAISQFETDFVPGYSVIQEPSTVAVSVWVGSDVRERKIAACVAVAIAARVDGKILDSEHKWSDKDLSDPQEFMADVRNRQMC